MELIANSDDLRALARRARETQHRLDEVLSDSERQLRDLDRRGWNSGDVDGPIGTARGLIREIAVCFDATESRLYDKAQILDDMSSRGFPDWVDPARAIVGLGFPGFGLLPNPLDLLHAVGDGAQRAFEEGEQLFAQKMDQLLSIGMTIGREMDAQLAILRGEALANERAVVGEVVSIAHGVVDEASLLEHQAEQVLRSAAHDVVELASALGRGYVHAFLNSLGAMASAFHLGRNLRDLDLVAGFFSLLGAGENPLLALQRNFFGQRSEFLQPMEQQRAQPGQPQILFVGGIRTNDAEGTKGTFYDFENDIRQNHKGMGFGAFDSGENEPGLNPLFYASTTVPVTEGAARMHGQLEDMKVQGESNIVLTGHSKGGAMIMEYMCEVAEGRLPMLRDKWGRPLISKVVIMDSPLNGGTTSSSDPAQQWGLDQAQSEFVGFERYGLFGNDRIADATAFFRGDRKVDFRMYDNPDDPVSSPATPQITHSRPLPKQKSEDPNDPLAVHGRVLQDEKIRNDYFEFITR
jgi:hypothetical protein